GERSVHALPFVAHEEEAPIARDPPAERSAELVLTKRRHGPIAKIEVVVRVEPVVAQKLERASVKGVRSGAGGDIDQRRGLAAELRRVLRLLDLEFLDRIHRRVDDEVVEELVGDRNAVEKVDVVTRALAANVGKRSGLL